MTTPMDWPEAVAHDRKKRKHMTRIDYAAHVGSTSLKVEGAEKGRRMRADTIEALLPQLADLLPRELGGTAVVTGPADFVTPEGGPTTEGGPLALDGIESLADYQAVKVASPTGGEGLPLRCYVKRGTRHERAMRQGVSDPRGKAESTWVIRGIAKASRQFIVESVERAE